MIKRIENDEFAVSPRGIHIGHTNREVDSIVAMANLGRAFVEIGVHLGGLADIMLDMVGYTFEYLGLEIKQAIVTDSVKTRVIGLDNASIWYVDAWSPETLTAFSEWLDRVPGPCVIYCDGGKKPLELALYAPLARPGDIVAVHDYGVYEGAEISPQQAEEVIEPLEYKLYRLQSGVRIAAWRA